jgi:hypothetical protein
MVDFWFVAQCSVLAVASFSEERTVSIFRSLKVEAHQPIRPPIYHFLNFACIAHYYSVTGSDEVKNICSGITSIGMAF